MKKYAPGFSSLGLLLAAAPALAADSAGSIWSRMPGELAFASGILVLALVAFYRWRSSKKQKPAMAASSKHVPGSVTITPATSKPKHGTEGVCCGSCSD
jgi:CCGSCS motif protein